jgi:prepilin-type N-terminal cleavage/methylation domain-containing protein
MVIFPGRQHRLFVKRALRGFSIPEVLAAAAILGVLATVGTELISNTFKMWRLTQARAETQRDARTVINLLAEFLKQASSASVTLDQLNSSEPIYSRIKFTTAAGDTFTFYQQQKTVMMTKVPAAGTTATTLLARNVRSMSFSFPISTQKNLINVALCFEVGTMGSQVKDFYMTLQKMRIENP